MLKRQLESKVGDVVVQPVGVEEVLAVARYAGEHDVPITVRGAGTGNYGQCIPLHGGIVLDLALMDKLEEITADGVAVCQPGLRLAPLEIEARRQGWELRMYPSTICEGASVGGFPCGWFGRHWIGGAWGLARLRHCAAWFVVCDDGRRAARGAA